MGTVLAILVTIVVLVVLFILISRDELDYDDLEQELAEELGLTPPRLKVVNKKVQDWHQEADDEIDLFNDIFGFLTTDVLNNTNEKIAALVEERFGIPAYLVMEELTCCRLFAGRASEMVIAAYYNLSREEQIEILRINRG